MNRTRSFRSLLLAGAGALALCAPPAVAKEAAGVAASFAQGPQDMAAALNAVAVATHTEVMFDAAAVKGLTAPALEGSMTASEALDRLLKGTSLTHVSAGEGTYVVRPFVQTAQNAATSTSRDKAVQLANTAGIEEIIVSGQRQLSAPPQDVRRSSPGIVDSVGAIEIGQLTDTTVADALTRIPSVSAIRGFQTQKASYVNIRGFDGGYNSVDLDGGFFFDSTRNTRNVYLDTVPANAINELQVAKIATPDMDANSIGGHISIKTLRSFDLSGDQLYRGTFSMDLPSQRGARDDRTPGFTGDVVVKDTLGSDRNFGYVLAGSIHHDQFNEKFDTVAGYIQRGGIDVPTGSVQHGNFDQNDYGGSLLAKAEVRADDRLYAFLEVSYFRQEFHENNYRGSLAINPASVVSSAEGAGQFTGATAEAYANQYTISRKLLSGTSGVEYEVTSESKLTGVVSAKDSKHFEGINQGARFNFAGVSGAYQFSDGNAGLTTAAVPGLGDPANWMQASGGTATVTLLPQRDSIYSGRLQYDYNDFQQSRGLGGFTGASVRRLHRVFDQSALNYKLPAGAAFPLKSVLDTSGKASAFDGVGPVFVDTASYFASMARNGTETIDPASTTDYLITEDAYAAFAAATYTFDKGRVLAGFRYEGTSLDDQTAQNVAGVITPFRFSRNYGYLLPNLQGTYDVADGWRLKLAYTETIARPGFRDFAQGLATNFDARQNVVITGSNYRIKARLSKNYDGAIEAYFPQGYATLSLFHKDIDHEIYSVLSQTVDATGHITQFTAPQNNGTSSITGAEALVEWRDFSSVSEVLKDFGVRANVTYLRGRLNVVSTASVGRQISGLAFQPAYLGNAVLLYETERFSASLAAQLRGRTLSAVGATAPGDIWVAPFKTLNARVGYTFQPGMQVFAEARNLTNEKWIEQTGSDGHQFSAGIQDGATFLVGAQVRF